MDPVWSRAALVARLIGLAGIVDIVAIGITGTYAARSQGRAVHSATFVGRKLRASTVRNTACLRREWASYRGTIGARSLRDALLTLASCRIKVGARTVQPTAGLGWAAELARSPGARIIPRYIAAIR